MVIWCTFRNADLITPLCTSCLIWTWCSTKFWGSTQLQLCACICKKKKEDIWSWFKWGTRIMPKLAMIFFFFFWNICSVQTRQCYETCQLGDYRIPAGTFIQIDVEAVHQNPEFWGPEDPKLFVPERCVNFCSKIGPSPESKPMIQWCVHACACAWRVQQRAIDSLSTKRNLQRKLKPNVTQLWKPIQYRNCHTLISHWMRNLGYVPFEFALQFTFGA